MLSNCSTSADVGHVAIYCYRDPEEAYWVGKPKIHFLDPIVPRVDKRHFIQQSCYTMCLKDIEVDSLSYGVDWASHEDAEDNGLIKYSLPAAARHEVELSPNLGDGLKDQAAAVWA